MELPRDMEQTPNAADALAFFTHEGWEARIAGEKRTKNPHRGAQRAAWDLGYIECCLLLRPALDRLRERALAASFQCPECFAVSFHPRDIEEGFCASCGHFHLGGRG